MVAWYLDSSTNERSGEAIFRPPAPGSPDVSVTPPPAGLEQVPVAQPNIDLQVSLRQWRPGLNTLLIDVAPYLLLCSQVDLDLWVIANGESHWKLPARQTWAPALFTVRSLVWPRGTVFAHA